MKTIQIRSIAGRLLATACLTVLCLHASADQFVQVTNPGWTNSSQYSWTGAWGDYDNDGFLDLFAASEIGKNALYHNLGNTNHWIKFQLEGTAANRTAIGAKVRVKAMIGGRWLIQVRPASKNSPSPKASAVCSACFMRMKPRLGHPVLNKSR